MLKADKTEEKILNSAREVFVEKGFDGARMQEIATRAGVNKALLNYYFRSKERMFTTVFELIFRPAMKNIVEIFDQDGDIFSIIEDFIRRHQRFVRQHPEVPKMIARELGSPKTKLFGSMYNILFSNIKRMDVPGKFISKLEAAVSEGIIRPISPVHLIVNILSMNIMYIVTRPLIEQLFSEYIHSWDDFALDREEEVVSFVLQSLRPDNSASK